MTATDAPAALARQHEPRPGARRSGLASLFLRRRRTVFAVLDAAVIIVFWHLAVTTFEMVNPVFVPAPVDVLKGFGQLAQQGNLWENLAFSSRNWVVGYGAGVLLGVATGLVAGSVAPVYRLTVPLLWAGWATPLIAIQPIIAVWFGFGWTPIVILVFLSTVIPVALNTVAGVSGVEPSLINAAKVFGAGTAKLYRTIHLPWTLPYIIGGMRLAVPTSLIGLLVGEMIGSPNGMGSIIVTSIARFRTNQAFSSIVFFIVVSVALVFLIDSVERRVGIWREVDGRG